MMQRLLLHFILWAAALGFRPQVCLPRHCFPRLGCVVVCHLALSSRPPRPPARQGVHTLQTNAPAWRQQCSSLLWGQLSFKAPDCCSLASFPGIWFSSLQQKNGERWSMRYRCTFAAMHVWLQLARAFFCVARQLHTGGCCTDSWQPTAVSNGQCINACRGR